MSTSHLAELKDQFRRLQGSVNYWNNAARAARKNAERHEGTRRERDLARLAELEKKAIAAQQQLDQIKAQLTELDPKGARTRQLRSLSSAIERARREIGRFEHLSKLPGQTDDTRQHWEQRLATRRKKLQQLLEAKKKHASDTEQLANQQRAMRECLAIAARPHSYSLDAEIQRQEARYSGLAVAAATTQQPGAVDALKKAIEHALRAGDQATADTLAAALAFQLEADPPPSASSTH